MTVKTLSGALVSSTTRLETLKAVVVAFALGLGLVYMTGFSALDTAHDAAHDSRHALSFPCH